MNTSNHLPNSVNQDTQSGQEVKFVEYTPFSQEQIQSNIPFACTSLMIKDKQNNVYHGRTMEFTTDQIVTNLTYYPKGQKFQHPAPDNTPGLAYQAKYPMMALTVPVSKIDPMGAMQGVNDQGLSFSLNMMTDSDLKDLPSSAYPNSVPFTSFGEWAIANFANITELKQGINTASFWSESIALIGGLKAPFHFALYDRSGQSVVVEVSQGALTIYDNPTGVMTNGPAFPWHLTNLNNYSNMNNMEVNVSKIGKMTLMQPDSGTATSVLPSSSTSVGRFVKAFFFSTFANVVDTPQKQVVELAHVMNNFDRPKNISAMNVPSPGDPSKTTYMTEFTIWTVLTDLSQGELYVRAYADMNYTKFTFAQYAQSTQMVSVPLY
ncbi:linear amide C-N hydrolase [Myroides sp. LJL115]